jgi:hypothetical protein
MRKQFRLVPSANRRQLEEAEVRRNREKLNRLLGLWGPDTDWRIAGELPEVPASDFPMSGLERLAISQRLDLQADYLALTSQAKNLGLTKSFRSRRKLFSNAVAAASATAFGTALWPARAAESNVQPSAGSESKIGNVQPGGHEYPPGEPGKDYTAVITPNGSTLPFRVVGGTKVYHLIAEEVDHEFAPGLRARFGH